jgi:hypothetical protein
MGSADVIGKVKGKHGLSNSFELKDNRGGYD